MITAATAMALKPSISGLYADFLEFIGDVLSAAQIVELILGYDIINLLRQ